MAEKKITKRENFANIEKFLRDNGKNEWADVMAHEIDLLAKKSGSSSTKKNEEQDKFLDLIRDVLAECNDVRGMRCGAIAKDSRIAEFEWADKKETSPQRVSAMLKKLTDCGDVVKVMDKKEAYFHLA